MVVDDHLIRNALILLGLSGVAAALVIVRAPLFHQRVYRPMLLNVGLAWTPMATVLAIPTCRWTPSSGVRLPGPMGSGPR